MYSRDPEKAYQITNDVMGGFATSLLVSDCGDLHDYLLCTNIVTTMATRSLIEYWSHSSLSSFKFIETDYFIPYLQSHRD